MDPSIERARRAARRRIDILLGESEAKLATDPVDKVNIEAHWKIVEREIGNLQRLDQQARDSLFESNVGEEIEDREFQKAKNYQIKIEET